MTNSNDTVDLINRSPLVLMEGAVIERLRRDPSLSLDPHILNAPLIYDEAGRMEMTRIYKGYIDISLEYDLPIMMAAPTWRVNKERLAASAFSGRDVLGEAAEFLNEIKSSYNSHSPKILVGGLMGCKGDAYKPEEAMAADSALKFHSFQAERLAEAKVDYLMAATLPALSEAIGMAKAMSGAGKPYIISFVIRPDGALLDGTRLNEAVQTIDGHTDPKPFLYMVNCVHPTVLASALIRSGSGIPDRFSGIQANTSAKSPEELDGATETETEDANIFAASMVRLHQDFGLKVLGGCCGTDETHIRAMAEMAVTPA